MDADARRYSNTLSRAAQALAPRVDVVLSASIGVNRRLMPFVVSSAAFAAKVAVYERLRHTTGSADFWIC